MVLYHKDNYIVFFSVLAISPINKKERKICSFRKSFQSMIGKDLGGPSGNWINNES